MVEELEIISSNKGLIGDKINRMSELIRIYNLEAMVCTLGGDGAIFVSKNKTAVVAGQKIKIVDTVGAGDAFLAGFVKGYLDGLDINEVLTNANSLGAKVASQKGAITPY